MARNGDVIWPSREGPYADRTEDELHSMLHELSGGPPATSWSQVAERGLSDHEIAEHNKIASALRERGEFVRDRKR